MKHPVYSKPAVKVSTPERRTYRGITYQSRAEAMYARALDAEKMYGNVRWWIRQPAFQLGADDDIYRADFLVVTDDGIHAVDVKPLKGETKEFRRWRRKWKLYGPCTLRVARRQSSGSWLHEDVPGGANPYPEE